MCFQIFHVKTKLRVGHVTIPNCAHGCEHNFPVVSLYFSILKFGGVMVKMSLTPLRPGSSGVRGLMGILLVLIVRLGFLRVHWIIGPPFVDLQSLVTMWVTNVVDFVFKPLSPFTANVVDFVFKTLSQSSHLWGRWVTTLCWRTLSTKRCGSCKCGVFVVPMLWVLKMLLVTSPLFFFSPSGSLWVLLLGTV